MRFYLTYTQMYRLAMAIAVDLGRKANKKTNKYTQMVQMNG